MSTQTIETKFGPAQVRVHRLENGCWRGMLIGAHRVPSPPEPTGPAAQSPDEAVEQIARAIERISLS